MLRILLIPVALLTTAHGLWAQPRSIDLSEPTTAIDDDFFNVRGGALLSDGRIVVANAGAHELRIYSPEGRPLRRVGRRGEGPGEFQSLPSIAVDATDSIYIFDWQLQRLSIFSPDGAFARSLPTHNWASGVAQPELVGFIGGTVLVIRLRSVFDAAQPEGVQRPPTTFLTVDRDGTVIDTLVHLSDTERWVRLRQSRFLTAPVPFGVATSSAIAGNTLVIGNQASSQIVILDRLGRTMGTLASPWESSPLQQEDLEGYREWRLARVPEQAREAEVRTLANIPNPSRRPAFGEVHGDAQGNILIERYRGYPGENGQGVLVRAENGPALRFTIPAGMEILWLDQTSILALARDELDVERVLLFKIPG